MKKIKLIQISDTHLCQNQETLYRGVNSYENLKRVSHSIAELHSDLDLLVVSGDVSEDESKESYQHLLDLLTPFKDKILWLPGNHDNKSIMLQLLPQQTSYIEIAQGPWRVVLLDSQVKGEVPGELKSEQIEKLKTSLSHHPDAFYFLVTHHHIRPVNGHMDKYPLINNEQILELIEAFPQIRLITHGHVHQNFCFQYQQTTILSCPSTATQMKPLVKGFHKDEPGPSYIAFELIDDGNFLYRNHTLASFEKAE